VPSKKKKKKKDFVKVKATSINRKGSLLGIET
jgi:hypothetical protein